MKRLLFLILLNILGIQISYSLGFRNNVEKFNDFYCIDNSKEYIIYEFGFSKINSVCIVRNDTCFDAHISDGDNIILSTRCKLLPILNWAFEKATHELATAQFVSNKEYKPLYYKLTIIVDNSPILIESSSMRIIGMDDVVEKIDELKRFIIRLWMDSLDAQNVD